MLESTNLENVIPLGIIKKPKLDPTPIVDDLEAESEELNKKSMYKSTFDWSPMRDLEKRSASLEFRGGFLFKSALKLVNAHSSCQQCLYAFELDTYGRGCVHNCEYCYAKAQLTVHGYWNRPFPAPINVNEIRNIFYTAFETDRPNKWRPLLAKRIPLRIGSMSDSFMWMDQKYKVTQEVLKILNHYKYPYVVFTRSDLVARDEYLKLMDPRFASIQMSISSTNDQVNKKLEPGAPSAARRIAAMGKISKSGYQTAVRINPLFPIYPDGYFTNPDFANKASALKMNVFDWDMVDQIANGCKSTILVGFGRFSSFAINRIESSLGFNFRSFFKDGDRKSKRDFHYSDEEIRYYYDRIKKKCDTLNTRFTTCYIGNGEKHFWKDQDLWSNKKDCCDIAGKLPAFKSSSRDVDFSKRLSLGGNKQSEPVDAETLHRPLGTDEAKRTTIDSFEMECTT